MGIPVLIIGASGSGKSCSLRNFEPNEVSIFNVAGKPLPFKKKEKLPCVNVNDANKIKDALVGGKRSKKTYVIDDSQYIMAFSMFARANETGYQKFTDMAVNFYNLVQAVIKETPNDMIVYFLHHSEDSDRGVKAKTMGKMLDSQLTLEGLFSIVLLAQTDGNRYFFQTQNGGFSTAKSPMGMFESKEIENDLKKVDLAIREYYELTINKEEKKDESGN